jgi:hypothetical protein
VNKGFSCNSGGVVDYYIPATFGVSIHPVDMALVNGQWIVSRLRGIEIDRGLKGCGFGGPPLEKWAIRGHLIPPPPS